MSMNKYMHPRNPYRKQKPDFDRLARDWPEFAAACQWDARGRVVVNFKLPHQLAALTRALLAQDFRLQVEMPLDRLIPTLPLRLNYLHWLEDILGLGDSATPSSGSSEAASRPIRGIDIGTGSCCIYPLLALRRHPDWTFLATEVDRRNAAYAQDNVNRNGMQDRIRVALAPASAGPLEFPLSLAASEEGSEFDFCMCNPPFFSDAAEAQGLLNSRSESRDPPMSASTAASVESFSSGGEVLFVTRIAQESSRHRRRCRIFTSMLGRKPSVKPLKRLLQSLGVASYGTYEFCQGRVMRWGIGWTFQPGVTFPMSEFKRRKLQSRPPLTLPLPQRRHSKDASTAGDPDPGYNLDAVHKWCKRTLQQRLAIDCWDQLVKQGATGRRMRISARAVTWTRQRHRRRHPSDGEESRNHAAESQLSTADQSPNDVISGGDKKPYEEKDDVNSSRGKDDVIGGGGKNDVISSGGKDNVISVGYKKPDGGKDDVINGGDKDDVISNRGRKKDENTDDAIKGQDDGVKRQIGGDDATVRHREGPPSKRARISSESAPPAAVASTSASPTKHAASKEPPVLVANLSLDYNDSGVIELRLGWLDGGGRDLMHQLLLYLRNRYAADDDETETENELEDEAKDKPASAEEGEKAKRKSTVDEAADD